MRIIVCGSKNFKDRKLLHDTMNRLTAKLEKVTLLLVGELSNEVRNVRRFAEFWAMQKWYRVEVYHPDPDLKPVEALRQRNAELVWDAREGRKNASVLVEFRKGLSFETKGLIDLARLKGLKIRTIREGDKT